MNPGQQENYWNRVANDKTFTHPINTNLLATYASRQQHILDYGCGYGRLTQLLSENGFEHVTGFDTSVELINRGKKAGTPNLFHIRQPEDLPVEDNSIDGILVFAVLTCIPSNTTQTRLIETLYSKLKPNGIIYLSDYYLQESTDEVGRYEYLDRDPENYGVFTLPEGVMFRHHTKAWIQTLLQKFTIKEKTLVEVNTMNRNKATAFQLIAQKI